MTTRPLPFKTQVDGRFHVVINAAPGNAAQRREGARVGIEQHFMALAGVGHQPESAAGAQLEVGDLQPVVNAAHHQALFAPVELEGLAQCETQRHKGMGSLAGTAAPGTGEVRHCTVAAHIAGCLDLRKQRLGRTPVSFVSMGVGLHGLLQLPGKSAQLAQCLGPAVDGHLYRFWRSEPAAQRVARQPRALGYFMQRQLVAQIHPSNLA